MDSKLTFFLIIISSLMFSQDQNEKSFDNISFKYEKSTSPDIGVGVIGSVNKHAYATFVENSVTQHSPQYFDQIKFKSISLSKKSSKIYLCIYENKEGLPGELIEGAKFLISIPTRKTFITADLSKLKIKVPETGYFVGFEWILSKENEIKGNVSTPNLPYNPTISALTANAMNLYSKEKKWRKEENSHLVAGLDLEISYMKN